jgi:hypothetical protein
MHLPLSPLGVLPLFERRAATIIRDARQRQLLQRWELRRAGRALPRLADLDHGDLACVLDDLVVYEVRLGPPAKRYRARLREPATEAIKAGELAERYLEDTVPEALQATIRLAYDATIVNRRPIYTVRDSVDKAHQPVAFERLLLPLSEGSDNVDVIITHLALHSAHGCPDRQNLLFEPPEPADYRLKAIIGPEAAPAPR